MPAQSLRRTVWTWCPDRRSRPAHDVPFSRQHVRPARRGRDATGSADGRTRVSESTTSAGVAVGGSAAAVEDAVEIRLPADSAYLSVLRTATAGLAARLDFTLDEIEDLRIAVDEACAMLLPSAIETAQLWCRFRLDPATLEVTVSIPTTRGQLPERDTFSWTVLSALAGEVDAGFDDERQVWIRLRKRRSAVGAA